MCVARLLSVCKQVKPPLSFEAVHERKNIVSNHVNVHSSVKRSDNRVQQPKVQGSTKTVHYDKNMQHNEVVKDSTDSGLQQGVSHIGRDVCSNVKSKCKYGSLLNNSCVHRFVHEPISTIICM